MKAKFIAQLLFLGCAFTMQAGRISLVGQTWSDPSNSACLFFWITIMEDRGDSDPSNDYVVAEGIVSSDGCFSEVNPGDGDPLGGSWSSVILSTSDEGGCELFGVEVYDGSGGAVASGTINSCTNKSSPVKLVQVDNGGSQRTFSDTKIYPTNVVDILHVEAIPVQVSNVSLFDITGKEYAIDLTILRETTELDMSDYPKGVYILKFVDLVGGVTPYKVIKI